MKLELFDDDGNYIPNPSEPRPIEGERARRKENDMKEPIYIETWEVLDNPKGNLLDIAYTRSMCPTDEAIVMFRRIMAETHRCVLRKLLRTRKIEYDENGVGNIRL